MAGNHYILKTGRCVTETRVHIAYRIATGYVYMPGNKDYSRWLDSLMSNSIVSVKDENDMTIEDFLHLHSDVRAMRVYQDRHGCTLQEAKDAVDQIMLQMPIKVERSCDYANNLCYILKNGYWATEKDMHDTYEIVTGVSYTDDSQGYSAWLDSLRGVTIVGSKREDDMTIEELLQAHSVVYTTKVYRDRHGCTLREAKDAVDKIRCQMPSKYDDIMALMQSRRNET